MRLLVVAALVVGITADIFSSTAHLQSLLHLERHLVNTLHEYVEKTESKLQKVKRYLGLFYDSYQDVLDDRVPSDGEEMVANPLQAYQLVKRLAIDWDFIKTAMASDDWHPVRHLTHIYSRLMPSSEDLQGAAMALVRLQDTYRLNITEVVRGDILGLPQGTHLTARDILFLGKQSFNAGYYKHAIQWLEEALRVAHLEGNRTAGIPEIMAFYDSAVEMHDDLFDRNDIDVKKYDSFGYPLRGNKTKMATLFTAHEPIHKLGADITDEEEYANYMALCRGERLIPLLEESKLFCRLDNRNNPYFLLMPLRVEERGLCPYVIQIHNLITDSQTDVLKQIAEPLLARSMVQAKKGSEVVSVSRTSQNAWVGPHDHPLMMKVYKLVEAVTGLSTDVDQEHAEIVQIANYGMGGHYTPHFDYLLVDKDPEEIKYVHPKEIDAGDRTATLMFYLSNVKRGGATVFPKIGASVWPEKGSAVFWHNLKRNGQGDRLTLHGACPVVHGSKWVANFWIREKGQMFRRRCSTDSTI